MWWHKRIGTDLLNFQTEVGGWAGGGGGDTQTNKTLQAFFPIGQNLWLFGFCGKVPSITAERYRFVQLSEGYVVIMKAHIVAKKALRPRLAPEWKCLYSRVTLTQLYSVFLVIYCSVIYICWWKKVLKWNKRMKCLCCVWCVCRVKFVRAVALTVRNNNITCLRCTRLPEFHILM